MDGYVKMRRVNLKLERELEDIKQDDGHIASPWKVHK